MRAFFKIYLLSKSYLLVVSGSFPVFLKNSFFLLKAKPDKALFLKRRFVCFGSRCFLIYSTNGRRFRKLTLRAFLGCEFEILLACLPGQKW